MIPVEEAQDLLLKNIHTLPIVMMELGHALHYTTSSDILSPLDSPPFDQSAMDGYAIQYTDNYLENKYPIQGTIAAGNTNQISLKENHALRIMTGAAMPELADTVVIQENVSVENNHIVIHDAQLQAGANVRKRGSQIQAQQIAMPRNTKLNPANIAYLTHLGIRHVQVYKQPRITIIVTGKELVKAGTPLQFGQVYESNSIFLKLALSEQMIHTAEIIYVDDDLQELSDCIQKVLNNTDMLLLTGGISVGDFDFVQEALLQNHVEKIFYKVKQKPGKPLYFGKKENTIIFALPGNPASVLSCYYNYVLPSLKLFANQRNVFQKNLRLPLTHDYTKKGSLTHFLKAKTDGTSVTITEHQESYKLNAFVEANCLVKLEAEKNNFLKNDYVEVNIFSTF